MSRKSQSGRNGIGAQRQGGCPQLVAKDKGFSVVEPCPVLVIATTGAGKTASVVLPPLSILGSAATPARVKGLAENR